MSQKCKWFVKTEITLREHLVQPLQFAEEESGVRVTYMLVVLEPRMPASIGFQLLCA